VQLAGLRRGLCAQFLGQVRPVGLEDAQRAADLTQTDMGTHQVPMSGLRGVVEANGAASEVQCLREEPQLERRRGRGAQHLVTSALEVITLCPRPVTVVVEGVEGAPVQPFCRVGVGEDLSMVRVEGRGLHLSGVVEELDDVDPHVLEDDALVLPHNAVGPHRMADMAACGAKAGSSPFGAGMRPELLGQALRAQRPAVADREQAQQVDGLAGAPFVRGDDGAVGAEHLEFAEKANLDVTVRLQRNPPVLSVKTQKRGTFLTTLIRGPYATDAEAPRGVVFTINRSG
jgi:hypothetical protein